PGERAIVNVRDVKHRLRGDELEVAGGGELIVGQVGGTRGFTVLEHRLDLRDAGDLALDLRVGRVFCQLLQPLRALLDGVQVSEHQLGVDDINIRERIDTARDVHNLGVVEAANDVHDRICRPNVAEELVTEALTLARAGDQTGDVDELHRGGDERLRLEDGGDAIQPLVRHADDAHVGVDGAERIVGGLRFRGRERVEDGGLADVRQPYDSTIKSHVSGSFPSLLLEHGENGSWAQEPTCAAALPKAFNPRAIWRRSFGLSTSARRSTCR